MFLKNVCTFLLLTLITSFFTTATAQPSPDYQQWSLAELLFTINSDLVSPEDKEVYIDYYLQKAKKEQATTDIITGYNKKILFYQDDIIAKDYVDSLVVFALQLNDYQIIGKAYDVKRHIEYIHKNYKAALESGLKAETYLEKAEDRYTLNKVKSINVSIYYHLEEYNKAKKTAIETVAYYKSYKSDNDKNAYNNLRGYISNLYSLSKTCFQLQQNDTVSILLKEGYTAIERLNAKDKLLETGYFNLINGMNQHRLKHYTHSDSLLNKALQPIQKNRDYANEHLIYLYWGKNTWETDRKEQAISYFKNIETLYQEKGFINVELSEAFSYLITYYQEQGDLKKELHYTKLLMQISNTLHDNNRALRSYIHTHLDNHKLEASIQHIEQELSKSKSKIGSLYVIIAVLLITGGIGVFYYQKTKKALKRKYSVLMQQQAAPKETTTESTPEPQPTVLPENITLQSTTQILLQKLTAFEREKGFLQKVTQSDLAKQFSTNRTTLSKVINDEKGVSFSDYLKKLRIEYAVQTLSTDNKLLLLTFDALAEEFGFGNAKSFSTTFKEHTQIPLTDFIKFRKQDVDRQGE